MITYHVDDNISYNDDMAYATEFSTEKYPIIKCYIITLIPHYCYQDCHGL